MGKRTRRKAIAATKIINSAASYWKFGGGTLTQKMERLSAVYKIPLPISYDEQQIIDFSVQVIINVQKTVPFWNNRRLRILQGLAKVKTPTRWVKKSKKNISEKYQLEIDEFYKSWEWKRLRYDFLIDRNRTCECCGSKAGSGIKIHVDHIKPIRKYWDLRLDKTNLQILCEDCNMGKGSRDETNWTKENVISFNLIKEQLKIRE